jgi:large subunit ribosomal protein L17
MHRHGYKGRKFGRQNDQRKSLIKSLANSLVLEESIETTVEKAKEVLPYVEKLITKAKKGDLHNRRQVIAKLQTLDAAHKLVDEIAPKLHGRVSGHLHIERTKARRGDNAQMATLEFVDDLEVLKPKKSSEQSKTEKKPAAKVKAEE